MGHITGKPGTPDKNKRLEDDIRQLKLEHNQQIDKLNFEIVELRQREIEARRVAEIESKKYSELSKDFEALKEIKQVKYLLIFYIICFENFFERDGEGNSIVIFY